MRYISDNANRQGVVLMSKIDEWAAKIQKREAALHTSEEQERHNEFVRKQRVDEISRFIREQESIQTRRLTAFWSSPEGEFAKDLLRKYPREVWFRSASDIRVKGWFYDMRKSVDLFLTPRGLLLRASGYGDIRLNSAKAVGIYSERLHYHKKDRLDEVSEEDVRNALDVATPLGAYIDHLVEIFPEIPEPHRYFKRSFL